VDELVHITVIALAMQAVTHSCDHDVAGWDDDRELATGSTRPEGIFRHGWEPLAGVDPKHAPVAAGGIGRCRGADEIDPTFRQDALTVPDTVLQMKLPESCPVT